jgi:hypothetical protein
MLAPRLCPAKSAWPLLGALLPRFRCCGEAVHDPTRPFDARLQCSAARAAYSDPTCCLATYNAGCDRAGVSLRAGGKPDRRTFAASVRVIETDSLQSTARDYSRKTCHRILVSMITMTKISIVPMISILAPSE